jgi:hypothetical protein
MIFVFVVEQIRTKLVEHRRSSEAIEKLNRGVLSKFNFYLYVIIFQFKFLNLIFGKVKFHLF